MWRRLLDGDSSVVHRPAVLGIEFVSRMVFVGSAKREIGRSRHAFTLVEILVVVAILALLAGLLFPVFATARGKARQVACLSNLRQLGLAFSMYAQDHDGIVPWAKDASDAFVPSMWDESPECRRTLDWMPYLHPTRFRDREPSQGALGPYVRNDEVWRCTSDTGFDFLDNNDSCDGPCPLPARPTMYAAF